MTASTIDLSEIIGMDTFDTHTHLVGNRLCAASFWELADYFWLNRELQAAGYPAHAAELPERERIAAFLEAYKGSRNTMMNQAFTHILADLYGIRLTDAASVLTADEAVRASASGRGWAQNTADRLHVRRFAVNHPDHAPFASMKHDALLIPRIDGKIPRWVDDIAASPDRPAALERIKLTIADQLEAYRLMGCPGVMTTLPHYDAAAYGGGPLHADSSRDSILMAVLHAVCAELQQRGMMMQIFTGVERSWAADAAAPVHDPHRIVKLYGLFERYAIPFELVAASELNNMDVVQAAWNFANVHVGGMWWFNFRPSTYEASFRYRYEALPAIKSSIVVSDARNIEWVYGKLVMVKKLLAKFLADQIKAGSCDRELALHVARCWLHDSAAKLYGTASS